MDKTSEKVLKYLIKSYKNNEFDCATITEKDLKKLNLSWCRFHDILTELKNNQMLKSIVSITNGEDVYLSQKAYSYFEIKRSNRRRFYLDLIISKISDIIVSFITALITAANWEKIVAFLSSLFANHN